MIHRSLQSEAFEERAGQSGQLGTHLPVQEMSGRGEVESHGIVQQSGEGCRILF
jgi:hypothetical protein